MSLRLAARMGRVKPSVTLAVTIREKKLRASGVDVVSFGAGEPDFDTPDHIKAAARAALDDPEVSNYTVVQGTPALRRAIADDLRRAHGVDYPLEQIIVSSGAKQGLFNLFLALLDHGDEVIVPAPYWVSYPDQVLLAGGIPVVVDTRAEDGFVLDPAALAAAITPRTRALVLNTPSNPTGAVYRRDQLEPIAALCREHDLLVVSDDIYRSLVYADAEYASIVSLPGMAEHTAVVDGVSKAYAMTGWRIGFTAAPAPLIAAMAMIQGQSTTGPNHLAQIAATAALTGPQECVAEMRRAFDQRRQVMVGRLRAIPGLGCSEPKGAFYALPEVTAYLGKQTADGRRIDDDVALADYLLVTGRVAVVPGSAFGAPGHLRLSYATSLADVERGCDRIAEALAALR